MPMDKVFNSAFLTAFVALFFARFFYVIFYPKDVFFNVLGFLLFPYFPGLSLLGAVLGGSIFLSLFSKTQKLPTAKFFDFFTTAFLSCLPVGFLGVLILTGKSYLPTFILSFLSYAILFLIFIKVFLPASFRGKIKNGSLGLIFLICFSVITFLSEIVSGFKSFNLVSLENFVILVLFLAASALFFKQEIIDRQGIRK